MPYQTLWVEPERFLEHRGVVVFHTYKHDDLDEGARRFEFTVNTECSGCDSRCDEAECRHVFDVTTLSTWRAPAHPPYCTGANDTPENRAAWERFDQIEAEAIRAAVLTAIEQGELTRHGVPPRLVQEAVPNPPQ